jgi:hypothetical protein
VRALLVVHQVLELDDAPSHVPLIIRRHVLKTVLPK